MNTTTDNCTTSGDGGSGDCSGNTSELPFSSDVTATPGGTNHWTPICSELLKPKVGQIFCSFENAYEFYKNYARACGFDVRKSTVSTHKDGTIVSKYVVCSRSGKYVGGDNQDGRRRCMITRCGCVAKIVLRIGDGCKVVLKKFNEKHNHALADDDGKHFLKGNRNMDMSQVVFCLNAAKFNMGASRAFSLLKEIAGGFPGVGSTAADFKNVNRDVKTYVGENDGEMIVQKFMNLKKGCPGFFFDYDVDEDGTLSKLVWADPISIRNFELFGDALSVDATFRSNKYQLKFVPFTGYDNHMRIVTFCAALISKEDIESYKWIFNAFKIAMDREPYYIVTDQCPAMKQAIPSVFHTAKHRLCAWHIMKKFPTKVQFFLIGANTTYYGEVIDVVNRLVYSNEMSPDEFELGWESLFSKYDLSHIEWLSDIYENRRRWVSAYHTDVPMGGLARTTSISESANSFFNNYYKKGDTLIEFYSRYESAIERQRNDLAKLNYDDTVARPITATPKKIEEHAAEVYTRSVFYAVQKEIEASVFSVRLQYLDINIEDEHMKAYVVYDSIKVNKKFQVKHCNANNDVECSCQMFRLRGILCRHAFFALNHAGVDKIPDKYLLRRWLKNAEKFATDSLNQSVLQFRALNEKETSSRHKMWLNFQATVNYAGSNQEKIDMVNDALESLNEQLKSDVALNLKKRKNIVIESIVGPQVDCEIGIKNPHIQRTKGSGNRIKSSVEKSQQAPLGRRCAVCGKFAGHNARTCPDKGKQCE